MKKNLKISILCMLSVSFTSCLGETKEKLNKVQEGVSKATTLVKETRKIEERIEKLKNATPLTNQQLKAWLPESLGDLKRTGFKMGQAGMYRVNSVEGIYTKPESKQRLSVMVIDGAGPTGSMMATGYGMFDNLEMEAEDEYKHQQTVTVDGMKAQQTYIKKTNDTQLMFAYNERFLITINTSDISVQETWEFTRKLNLEELTDLTE